MSRHSSFYWRLVVSFVQPSQRRRAGFTLVELLVVIAIIAMLAGLLLPAVNSARESGRQTQCLNNQRNFGQAIQTYVSSKGYYPGYRSLLPLDGSTAASPKTAVVNWQIALMPNLGKSDQYDALKASPLAASGSASAFKPSYLELALCPSDSTTAGKSSPWTSYVVNTGQLDIDGTVTSSPISKPDQKYDGVFQDLIQPTSRQEKVTNTDFKDGQATTLMMGENLDSGYYIDQSVVVLSATPATVYSSTLPNFNSNYRSGIDFARYCTERGAGFMWRDYSNTSGLPSPAVPSPTYNAINIQRGDWDPEDSSKWPSSLYDSLSGSPDAKNYAARPSSAHPGGVVVAFAGGNTKFLKEDIDYKIYCLLMTPNGAKSRTVFTGWQKASPLNEADF